METATKLKMTDVLPKKKVVLMPVPRDGGMISDPKHKGFFMFEGAKARFVLPMDANRGGALVQILTEDERKFFEERLGLDLNFFKPKDNFWHTFEIVILKDDSFMQNGKTFDLSDPMDNLRWRVLCACKDVAKDWEERYNDGEYRFAFREAGYVEDHRAKRAETMQQVYKAFNKMDSAAKLYNFLSVYWMETNKAKRPPEDVDIEVYKGMVQDIIDNDAKGFLNIVSDPKGDSKLMVLKALKYNIITKKSITGDFETNDGRYLGKTLNDAVSNLLTAEFNETLLRIQAQITTIE